MSKMSELSAAIDALINCGNGMVKAAEALKVYYSSDGDPLAKQPKQEAKETVPAPVQEAERPLTKEDVRKLLVAKSTAGSGANKPAVKALVKKYSSTGQLSDVPPEKYADMAAELEGIGNA